MCKPHFDYPFIVNGDMSCFYHLAIMNNAATNISVQVSESLLSIPLGTYLKVKLLDQMAILC